MSPSKSDHRKAADVSSRQVFRKVAVRVDGNKLVVPVGRIVRGWNIIRAYGSFFHLAPSNPLAPFHLPCPKLFIVFFFFLLFNRYLRVFLECSEGASGSVTCRLSKPFLPVAYFYPNQADELIFTDLLYARCSVLRFSPPLLRRVPCSNVFRFGHLSTACQDGSLLSVSFDKVLISEKL